MEISNNKNFLKISTCTPSNIFFISGQAITAVIPGVNDGPQCLPDKKPEKAGFDEVWRSTG